MKRFLSIILTVLMLASVLSVTASAAELPFTDVPEPFQEAVQYVYDAGLMNGISDTEFGIELPYTRAMFVTMLGRMDGVDPAEYPGTQFKDVAADNWAAPYINWAAKNNIVNGVGNGLFAPKDTITEEQYCTIVCRYMDANGIDFTGAPVWTPEIADMDEVSTWAKAPVVNMVYYNLVGLTSDFRYLPQSELYRGLIAYYFMNLHYMLNTGEVPEQVYDPATFEILDGDDIICILRGAASYIGNWFYFNSYCDKNDTIKKDTGTYEKVVNPYFIKKQDVVDRGYLFFVADMSRNYVEEKDFLEQGYNLYESRTDGLGGFMIDRAHIDADIEDASYKLTISYYSGDELMFTQETSLHYDGSRWVVGDLIDVSLMYADMDVAWG